MRRPITLSRLPRHKKTYSDTLVFALDFTECVVSLAFEPGSASSGHQELQQTARPLSNESCDTVPACISKAVRPDTQVHGLFL